MPRDYTCNVIYTLVGEPFAEWVHQSCEDRNKKFQEGHGMEIKLQSRIAEAALASTAINRKFISLI